MPRAAPTDGEAGDYDALLKLIADARLVLLGVPSYGTHEFFHARGEVTKRLIQDKGFTSPAMAADPAAVQPIDDFVKGRSDETLATDALADLTVFPRWTWRNAEMLDFVGWLRSFDDQFSGDTHDVSVCGIDVDRASNTVIWEHSRNVGDSRAIDSKSSSLGTWLETATVVARSWWASPPMRAPLLRRDSRMGAPPGSP